MTSDIEAMPPGAAFGPSHRTAAGPGPWSLAQPGSMDALQIVYKVAERCNINCSYCYYFNMGEETPLERPALASLAVTQQLADWIAQGCRELDIPLARVSFHGGEPTMMKLRVFDEACRILRQTIEPVARLSLGIQTNGVLLDERWVEAFTTHRVAVGVSIDGPEAENDRFRLDKRGRSTFRRTEDAIRMLVEASRTTGALPATISVVHRGNDYRKIYRYLRDLGVQELNFLLPDRNMDDAEFLASGAAADYGDCLAQIFEAWLAEDNPKVRIKFIEQMLSHFGRDAAPGQVFQRRRKSNQVVIARSDGTVAIDDTFIPALAWYERAPVHAMASSTLRQFLADPIFPEIEAINGTLPRGCADCTWRKACRGGDLENRYSTQTGFDNPSVYCDAYKVMYQRACEQLVRNGYPADLVAAKFALA